MNCLSLICSSLLILPGFCLGQFPQDFQRSISSEDCKSIIDSVVSTSWKFKRSQDYYKTSFIPEKQGSQKIEFPCINKLNRNNFQLVFGIPHLSFEYQLRSGMQPVKFNDIGERVEQEKLNTTVILDRYFTTKNREYGYENNMLEVRFYPPRKYRPYINSMVAKNCENILDTLSSRLSFNDSLDYYQYKKKREIFRKDVELYSSCLYGMDTIMAAKVFGKPSLIIKHNEWEYRTSNYYQRGIYSGNGMTLLFNENGKLNSIYYIFGKPLYDPNPPY